MFVRDPAREREVRELSVGKAAFLGAFEDGINTYRLLIDSGEVWMVHGHDDAGDRRYLPVDTSVVALQQWRGLGGHGRSHSGPVRGGGSVFSAISWHGPDRLLTLRGACGTLPARTPHTL
ncbi:hypothetical protein [Streptomyces sp. NPDC054958]